MNKGIFIVGTDTDIGKTFISALIVKSFKEKGINAGYFKSVLSGARTEEEKLIPIDAEEVCNISGLDEDYNKMVSYTLKNPYSPHLASKIENVDIKIDKIIDDYNRMQSKYEYVVVEGSGGIVCPIKIKDKNIILLEDIIKNLKLSTIVVAKSELGTINHTTLTVKYLQSIGIEVKAIVLNKYNPHNIIHKDNKESIRVLTGIDNIVTMSVVDKKSSYGENFHELNMLISLIK